MDASRSNTVQSLPQIPLNTTAKLVPAEMSSLSTKTICQFGDMCFLKNAEHFHDYGHPELEKIVLKGKNKNQEYEVPDSILAPIELTREQLSIIEKVMIEDIPGDKQESRKRPAPHSMVDKVKTLIPVNLGRVHVLTDPGFSPEKKKRARADVNKGIPFHPLVKTEKVDPKLSSTTKKEDQPITQSLSLSTIKVKKVEPKKAKVKGGLLTWLKMEVKPEPSSVQLSYPSMDLSSSSQKTLKIKSEEEKPKEEHPFTSIPDPERKIEDYLDVIYPKGEALQKYQASHPYNFFLTAIVDSPRTHSHPGDT